MLCKTLPLRALFAAAAVAFISLPALPVHSQAPAWPQAASDIPWDPAIRLGALPSGMRYAIMKNTTPKGEVSLRLRIGAGSLQEEDAQRGLAHFTEHMAFRGSKHVPDGEIFKTLERMGLRTGADSNARTGEQDTVYQFDLPSTDAKTVDYGLMLTRDIVGELSLSAESFQSERGPVLSEERLRDGPGLHAFDAQTKFLLKGQLAADRSPIGTVDVLQKAPVSLLGDFYHSYYRPERTQLVIVGDFDVDQMEAKVKDLFGDWKPSGQGRSDPDFGTPAKRAEESAVFVETGAPQFATVSWVSAYDASPDTTARRTRNRLEAVGLAILNQRMAQAAQATDAPFQSAGVSRGNTAKSAKITTLHVNYAADKWQRALTEADKIRRQILEQGVTQAEVDRQVTNALANAQADVAAAPTRQSRALAQGIIGVIARDGVFNAPDRGLMLIEADLKGLRAETVNAALKDVFVGSGPLLFLSSQTAVQGGQATLASVFHDAERATVANAAPPQVTPWPYTNFGTPGTVVDTRKIADLDVTFLRFANGVKLTVKPTKFRADQVIVSVSIAGGELAFPKDRQLIDAGAFLGGGLEAMSFIDIRRTLAGKIYGVGFDIDDDSFSLSGATRPADLDTQMQVLAAFMTRPGWRPEYFQQSITSLKDGLAKLDINPMQLFGSKLPGFLHSGDPRWETPTLEEVEKARLDDFKSIITPALANAPLEITIVGDITVEQATKAVASTFGALAQRNPSPYAVPKAGDIKFPAATSTPVVLYHRGRADQGAAAIAWPTTDVFADTESAARRLVVNVLQSRLMEQLRMKSGATYSPQTTAHASLTFPGYGYIGAYAELPPDKTALFYETVAEVAADLREHGPTADEFERARRPEIDSLERAMETNAFWRSFLTGAQTDERRLDLLRQAKPRLEQVTPADVQRVSQKYLRDDRAWKLVVAPKT